jgi:hypothetical protein
METSRSAAPPLEDPITAGILIYSYDIYGSRDQGDQATAHSCGDFGYG